MKRKARLPKTIYVIQESDLNDPNESYLLAAATTDSIDHDAAVGVYELKETRRMEVTRELK